MADITITNQLSAKLTGQQIPNISAELSGPLSLQGDVTLASEMVTKDYNRLINHPSINGVELVGNKIGAELGFSALTEEEVIAAAAVGWR